MKWRYLKLLSISFIANVGVCFILRLFSSTSELFLDKPHLPKVGRSESMKTPVSILTPKMNIDM